MSFICERCNKPQSNGSSPVRVPVAFRDKTYPERKRGRTIIDRGGTGFEIVREAILCEDCSKKDD